MGQIVQNNYQLAEEIVFHYLNVFYMLQINYHSRFRKRGRMQICLLFCILSRAESKKLLGKVIGSY